MVIGKHKNKTFYKSVDGVFTGCITEYSNFTARLIICKDNKMIIDRFYVSKNAAIRGWNNRHKMRELKDLVNDENI